MSGHQGKNIICFISIIDNFEYGNLTRSEGVGTCQNHSSHSIPKKDVPNLEEGEEEEERNLPFKSRFTLG